MFLKASAGGNESLEATVFAATWIAFEQEVGSFDCDPEADQQRRRRGHGGSRVAEEEIGSERTEGPRVDRDVRNKTGTLQAGLPSGPNQP